MQRNLFVSLSLLVGRIGSDLIESIDEKTRNEYRITFHISTELSGGVRWDTRLRFDGRVLCVQQNWYVLDGRRNEWIDVAAIV